MLNEGRDNMKDVKTILKEGVTLHEIKTDKFKTNLCAVFYLHHLQEKI